MARRLWGLFVFLLAVGALGAAAYLYKRLQKEEAARAALEQQVAAIGPRFEQFKSVVRDVNRELSANVFQEIDLAAAGWQPIVGGFYVIDLSVAAAGKGSKVAGKIINPTSVTHEQAQFVIRIGDERAGFSLAKVPPVVAQPFEVVFADVAPAAAKRAFIALQGSTISFASSTTRKRPGPEPVDTDKLLK
jgi:hypothetical protein